jgi:hypothetical protein
LTVVYDGIRLTPAEIAAAAKAKKPHVIGLSILSGSHKELVAEVMRELKAAGITDTPVIVGGIVPPEDEADPRYHPRLYAARTSTSTPSWATCWTWLQKSNLYVTNMIALQEYLDKKVKPLPAMVRPARGQAAGRIAIARYACPAGISQM